jgi:hypothetical protein
VNQIADSLDGILLYRATTDGFEALSKSNKSLKNEGIKE